MFDDETKGKERRKQLRDKAKVLFRNVKMTNKDFNHEVVISVRNIKEILNQPHKNLNEKNEAILEIDKLFSSSTFKGELSKENETDGFTSYIFEIQIADSKSWIIVRKYDTTREFWIYSISDQEYLLKHLKKKEI